MLSLMSARSLAQDTNIFLPDVPAYIWQYGCFGTASGIFMAFWDRNGYPDVYTGPTANGLAPITSASTNATIRGLWASQQNYDGHSTNYGHVDDYWVGYTSTAPDPYATAERPEHEPDCIGDFIGLNQKHWTNLNGECDGNIDAFVFNYYDTTGVRRINFVPGTAAGLPPRDLQSGLKSFFEWRGYAGESFSQLVDVWHQTPEGMGFTFEDLKREINAGYPLLLMLQETNNQHNGNNPQLHGVVVGGYRVSSGIRMVHYRDGWGTTLTYDSREWSSTPFYPTYGYMRGVISLRPQPQIRSIIQTNHTIEFSWDGPCAILTNGFDGTVSTVHWYVVMSSTSLNEGVFSPVGPATAARSMVITNETDQSVFYRLRHLERVDIPDSNLNAVVQGYITNKYATENLIFDIDLEQLSDVDAAARDIYMLDGLEYANLITNLNLMDNQITQINALVENLWKGGFSTGDVICLSNNPLNTLSLTNQIPILTNSGVVVWY